MAIQDRKIVLMDLEKQLGSLLTANQLTAAMEIVATELGNCELTYQADGTEDSANSWRPLSARSESKADPKKLCSGTVTSSASSRRPAGCP